MTASRKTLFDRIRAKALAIHQANGCPDDEPCTGPTVNEIAQATKAIMRDEKKAAS